VWRVWQRRIGATKRTRRPAAARWRQTLVFVFSLHAVAVRSRGGLTRRRRCTRAVRAELLALTRLGGLALREEARGLPAARGAARARETLARRCAPHC
jgi:hypothetical protein